LQALNRAAIHERMEGRAMAVFGSIPVFALLIYCLSKTAEDVRRRRLAAAVYGLILIFYLGFLLASIFRLAGN
jgi:hypothetical protein